MSDKPGRNSPCPCGSGKKFKKCCGYNLAREMENIIEPMPEYLKIGTGFDVYFEAFNGVMLYGETLKSSPKFGADLRRIWKEFAGRFKPGAENGLTDSFFMNWFVLDNRFGVDQRTVIERMMEEKIFKSSMPEVQEVIRALSNSYATCYEVKELRRDTILFEEFVTGRKWIVHRMGDPCEDDAKRGIIWYSRFVGPDTDAYYFGQPFIFGPEAKPDFVKIVRGHIDSFKEYISTRSLLFEVPRDAFKAAVGFWAEYLYRSSQTDAEDQDDEDYVDSKGLGRTIVTTDGEKMRFSTVILKIIQQEGLRDRLSRMQGLEYDEKASCWVWLKKGNRKMKSWENTLLGCVLIRENELIGEVNSLERALRLKNKLAIGLGKMVAFDRIDSKDLAAMPPSSEEDLRKFEDAQRELHANPEVRKALLEHLEEYYLKGWISSKIPALENKTPLQAVKTKEGRLQLEALINHMEGLNGTRPEYIPTFDMNLLRQKLGLPLRSSV